MKNKVGIPARGNDFFKRETEVQKILLRLADGNNLQITAPRRVGKTSILWHLRDNKINGYTYVYIDTEAVADTEDFQETIKSYFGLPRSASIYKT